MSRLASKERVSIANFRAWRPTERVSRTNRNIHIGPMIQVAARRAVTWSPGTEFNNRMKRTYSGSNHDAAVGSSGRSSKNSSEGRSPSRSRSIGGCSG